ncbi:MAG: sensor histidine kinase [Planctomycetales bacterium]
MSSESASLDSFRFDLAAESITLRIRWFGVCVGFALVNLIGPDLLPPGASRDVLLLNTILGIGVAYVALDTFWSYRGKVFLSDWPLAVSLLETVFIGLLCHFDLGQESPFRFYYLLSVVVCAIRYAPVITYTTFLFHATSYTILLLTLPSSSTLPWVIMVVSMGWVTWASIQLSMLIRIASKRLADANEQLEHRIAERTQELRESQAMLVQHEKQAAFGLLAAGIAHEVGNPLAAISSLVQLLKRKSDDTDTIDRYQMIGDQLRRIQGTLRELVDFSRPANTQPSLCDVRHTVEEALSIAKYYKRRKGKRIVTRYAAGLPSLRVVHDQLVQVFLNLILNAMDATPEGGTIEISTSLESGWIRIAVRDTGHGIREENRDNIFEPYYTTKSTGTGLGLFVCRQLLERESNGRIDLTETGSEGTTFSVMLTGDDLRDRKDIPAPDAGADHSLSVGESVLPAPDPFDESAG